MDPLLEKELELAAQRQGVSKSQFIIAAVERALGRRNAYELMVELQAQEPALIAAEPPAATASELPYATDASKAALRRKLKVKHDVGSAG
jgi:RHH-type rel operon transcriptional repressor/antitoxin RelB